MNMQNPIEAAAQSIRCEAARMEYVSTDGDWQAAYAAGYAAERRGRTKDAAKNTAKASKRVNYEAERLAIQSARQRAVLSILHIYGPAMKLAAVHEHFDKWTRATIQKDLRTLTRLRKVKRARVGGHYAYTAV